MSVVAISISCIVSSFKPKNACDTKRRSSKAALISVAVSYREVSSYSPSYGLRTLAFSRCLASIVTVHPHREVVLLIANFQDQEEATPLFVVFFQRPGIPGKRPA